MTIRSLFLFVVFVFTALLGGLVTASLQMAVGYEPIGGRMVLPVESAAVSEVSTGNRASDPVAAPLANESGLFAAESARVRRALRPAAGGSSVMAPLHGGSSVSDRSDSATRAGGQQAVAGSRVTRPAPQRRRAQSSTQQM